MTRAVPATAAVCALAVAALLPLPSPRGTPLWPGGRYTCERRDRAVRSGLDLVYRIARDPRHFADWGHDLVGTFAGIALTSRDVELRRTAWTMGRERAREWRRLHPAVPPGTDAGELGDLVFADESCDRLEVRAPHYTAALRQAARRFSAMDFLLFDPAHEPPPAGVPEECPQCGHGDDRGVRACTRCGHALAMRTRYSVWLDALLTAYVAERQGVPVGARYADVLRWVTAMRPYPARHGSREREYMDAVYAVTHLVYTLNRYSVYRIDPACLPDEFAYLRSNLREAIAMRDPETMGEYLDTLRAFGMTPADPLLQTGIEYLLDAQNPDGSWGDVKARDIYLRYHPTWTAIDGLREYRWQGTLPCPVK